MDSIPAELRARKQWVTWRSERGTKVPYDAYTGKHASSTKSHTWAPFDLAVKAAQTRKHDGVGYVFAPDDPYVGIDLDDCLDDAGALAPWAAAIVQAMGSYTEVSPSGHGLKIWVVGDIPGSVKTSQIEIYDRARYFTVTGRRYDDTPTEIRPVNGALDDLYASLKPSEESKAEAYTTQAADDSYLRAWADRVIESAEVRMRLAPDRTHHNTRLSMGRLLGGLIRHGLMTEDRAERILYDALPPEKNQKAETQAIRDGIANGKADPLTPPPAPPQPIFDAALFACCPEHKRRLEKGRTRGWYCPETDQGAASGWCNFWWDGKGYTPPEETKAPTLKPSTEYIPSESPSLVPLTGSALMLKDIPPTRHFVQNMIRAGLAFFIGQPGVGKTPALVQLAIAFATGGLWLGAFRVPKIKVAYIGPEYDEGDTRNTIMESTGGRADLDNLLIFTIENFSPPRSEEEALQLIDNLVRVHQVEAIIIDLFTGFLPPEKFKQNAYRGDYREFLAYHRAALAYGITLIGAWHGTKRDANPATMYNGGQGFWGSAGGGRLVMYQDEEDQVKLYTQLRGNKAMTYTMSEAHIAGCRIWAVLEGTEPEPAFGSDIHRAIYRTVKEHTPEGGLTPRLIAELVRSEIDQRVSEPYIRKCIAVLTKRGLLKQVGDKYVVKNGGSQGSRGSQGSESARGSQDRDPSDPSPIPSPIPLPEASYRPRPSTDPSDPSDPPIPEVFDGVPLGKQTNLRLYLRSNKESDQERAQEMCERYGVNYDAAYKAVQKGAA